MTASPQATAPSSRRGTCPSAGARRRRSGFAVAAALATLGTAGFGGGAFASSAPQPAAVRAHGSSRTIVAIGTESEYANVVSQIGGRYVRVSSILNNPNTDPHTYESSPSVARAVSTAQLIVQNGVGYDTWMNKMESASSASKRKVITVQSLLGLPNSTPNPHLWYEPTTMPAVAMAVAAGLGSLDPSHAAYFRTNVRIFDESLRPWLNAIAAFKKRYGATPAATTEPVADYLLQAMGVDNLTPFRFQADVMNGVDPSPQDISLERSLFSAHKVKFFAYNEQVADSLTNSMRTAAERAGIPVVGVYETMPTPGFDYQTWMLAEVRAIEKAVTAKASTEKL